MMIPRGLFIAALLTQLALAAPEDSAMRVTLKIEGGIASFPGLQQPVSVAVDTLPSKPQAQMRSLIADCDFFNLPPRLDAPAPGAADYRTYVITVETAQQTHTVTVHDPVRDERLQRLIQLLRASRNAR
jgi:hypothetical protein